jgi:hypothetical protein
MTNLTITDSKDSFENWIARDFIPENMKASLSTASILILPFEDLRPNTPPVFPIGTEDIFRFFKENLKGATIDICISDSDYQEFAFYSDYKRLGNFMVTAVAVPVFVTVLSTFVYDKFIKEDETKPQIQIIDNSTQIILETPASVVTEKKYLEPTHIKFSVTVVDSVKGSKQIDYEGPAKDLDSVLNALKEYEK